MDVAHVTEVLFSLLTLTLLEVILGIDNLVFIAIASSRLPIEQQKSARRFGLLLAMVTRLALLASVTWLAQLTTPLFTVFDQGFSVRDVLLLSGGLFLLYKGTQQIHEEAVPEDKPQLANAKSNRIAVIVQIAVLDIVFSFDSVFTAVGMTNRYSIMAAAIIIAILCMIVASEPLSHFIERNPTVKMLALSFILLVGTLLVADSFHFHVPRGYVYFAISYAIFVEILNAVVRRQAKKYQS
ncbi:MAG: TerC family protein [Coxiellaceae bacterium]|nr:TerC family protein [Coxiellaceae bacterium]